MMCELFPREYRHFPEMVHGKTVFLMSSKCIPPNRQGHFTMRTFIDHQKCPLVFLFLHYGYLGVYDVCIHVCMYVLRSQTIQSTFKR